VKVWVVLRYYDYEGHGVPLGVFSSLELAHDALCAESDNENCEIYEYVLDAGEGNELFASDFPRKEQP
jgi:hypothetical protein